ncbi:hypothetical protein D3C87_1210900 [compost metagenome]
MAEAAAEDRHGFLHPQAQGVRADDDIEAAGLQVGHLQVQAPTGGHDDAQVGRGIVQQVGQAMTHSGFG